VGNSIAHRSFVFGAFDRSTEAREAVCGEIVRQGVRIPSGLSSRRHWPDEMAQSALKGACSDP